MSLFICVILILAMLFSAQSCSTQRKLRKMYETELQKNKDKYLSDIEERNKRIKFLLSENEKQNKIISDALKSIDSLQKQKNKIEIKYKVIYKEIELFNTEDIKNYWQNEFKN